LFSFWGWEEKEERKGKMKKRGRYSRTGCLYLVVGIRGRKKEGNQPRRNTQRKKREKYEPSIATRIGEKKRRGRGGKRRRKPYYGKGGFTIRFGGRKKEANSPLCWREKGGGKGVRRKEGKVLILGRISITGMSCGERKVMLTPLSSYNLEKDKKGRGERAAFAAIPTRIRRFQGKKGGKKKERRSRDLLLQRRKKKKGRKKRGRIPQRRSDSLHAWRSSRQRKKKKKGKRK